MFPEIRKFAVVTFAAASLCFPANTQVVSQSARSNGKPLPAKRLNVEGIPNIAEVTPNLYRGGVPPKQALKILANMGIRIVVDLRGSSAAERKEVTDLGMQYVALPWHCPFPRDAVFARFLTLLQENRDKKVFVHCRLGDDRAGMMIAAYRIAEQGWTPEEAMKEMELYGFTFSHRFLCPAWPLTNIIFPSGSEAARRLRACARSRKPRARSLSQNCRYPQLIVIPGVIPSSKERWNAVEESAVQNEGTKQVSRLRQIIRERMIWLRSK